MKKENINNNEQNTQNSQNAVKNKKHSAVSIITKSVIAVIVVVFLFAFGFTYQVKEGSCAIVMRFGAVRKEVTDSGLYFKLPWPFETVISYDSRLQYFEAGKVETTTEDNRNISLQSYVVWDIKDPKLYHERVGVRDSANSFINNQISSATTSTLGKYKLTALVSLNRDEIKIDEIQNEIFTSVNAVCENNYGIEVKDVSILRISLPDTNLESVFEQMWADREKDIDIIISNANTEANKIITDSKADAAEIVGQGTVEAAKIKAEVEKSVAKIYADAQEANLELYKFLTNLDALVNSVNSSTVLVVKSDKYPFNILTQYSKDMAPSSDEVIIRDLNYILSNPELPAADRQALIDAIFELIQNSANKNGIDMGGAQ